MRWWFALFWVVTIVLLAGGTAVWGRGLVLAGTGMFLIIAPWRQAPPAWWITIGSLTAALIGISILPLHSLTGDSLWRQTLTDLDLALQPGISPQPIVTLEAAVCWLAAWLWLGWCLSNPLSDYTRRSIIQVFGLSAVVLAIGVCLGNIFKLHYPFTEGSQVFSYFPNRNQTACWFAMAGTATCCCMLDAFQRRSRKWVIWLLALILIATATTLTYSRGGVAALGLACMVALIVWPGQKPWQRGMLGIGALIAVLLAWYFGAPAVARIEQALSASGGSIGLRGDIYKDAWSMALDGGLLGHGLGQFQTLYPSYITFDGLHASYIHPESDWFWWATELGLAGVLLVLGGLCVVMFGAFQRLRTGSFGHTHWAAALALLAFAIHSVMDVGAHRFGTALTACLLLGLLNADALADTRQQLAAWISRGFGVVLIAVGAAWFATGAGWATLHSTYIEEQAISQTQAAIADGDLEAARDAANAGLQWRPLSWPLIYLKGLAALELEEDTEKARTYLRQARSLAAANPVVALNEGRVWIGKDSRMVLEAWRDALDRPHHNHSELYQQMLKFGARIPELLQGLQQMAMQDSALLETFLERANADAFEQTFRHYLLSRPTSLQLDDATISRLLSQWLKRASNEAAIDLLEDFPALGERQWGFQAEVLARKGQYEAANQLVIANAATPTLPRLGQGIDLVDHERQLLRNPDDIVALTALAHHYEQTGYTTAALRMIKGLQRNLPEAQYLLYWQARIQMANGNQQAAWEAFKAWLST